MVQYVCPKTQITMHVRQVCWYNYSKITAAQRVAVLPDAKAAAGAEGVQLLERKKGASQV